jgi:hypothetical protein
VSKAQQHDQFNYKPESYRCLFTTQPITVDGVLRPEEWGQAPWTNTFVDIEGQVRPKPYYDTRVKMLWDSQYFYIAAQMEEEGLWATYDKRDMVIFHENDFEVFIDPNGDTHNYYELEINALGTVWDLLLTKPYRDHGKAIDAWDIAGLKSAVYLNGTLNQPADKDKYWSVELAFPWQVLEEAASHPGPPREGEVWRVNFSRVHWRLEANQGAYRKQDNPDTGKPYPEYNWVWSPQGVIAMHQPETWGYVQFSTSENSPSTVDDSAEAVKWQLRKVYYELHAYHAQHETYQKDTASMKMLLPGMKIYTQQDTFLATKDLKGKRYYIREDGKVWSADL